MCVYVCSEMGATVGIGSSAAIIAALSEWMGEDVEADR